METNKKHHKRACIARRSTNSRRKRKREREREGEREREREKGTCHSFNTFGFRQPELGLSYVQRDTCYQRTLQGKWSALYTRKRERGKGKVKCDLLTQVQNVNLVASCVLLRFRPSLSRSEEKWKEKRRKFGCSVCNFSGEKSHLLFYCTVWPLELFRFFE